MLLDHKLKQKEFFLWLEYLLTLGDVVYKQKFREVDICQQKIDLMILEYVVSVHLPYWNSLKGMKLLKCKTSINKIFFSVKKLLVTMFVIFSLVGKIIKLRFLKF
jgi:hypothetical protein